VIAMTSSLSACGARPFEDIAERQPADPAASPADPDDPDVGKYAAELLVEERVHIQALAADEEGVYWFRGNTLGGQASIRSLSLRPGATPRQLAEAGGCGVDVLVDATHVYWLQHERDRVGAILRVAKAGGAREAIATDLGRPGSLRLFGDDVYVAIRELGEIYRFPKTGGDLFEVARSNLYSEPWGLAVDDEAVYWTPYRSAEVYGAPRTGGEETRLVVEQGAPTVLASDAEHLYFLASSSYAVMKVSKRGGPAEKLASGGAYGLAVDDRHVYYIDGPRLMRVSKLGGARVVLWTAPSGRTSDPLPTYLALSTRHVYVATYNEAKPGAIYRVLK
jgi:hypothetical protein